MPTHSGPNTLGESNLVFAYDTGDIENSYKGEPTVNLIDSVNFTSDIASWNAQENVIITRNQLNPIGVIDNSCLKIHPNSGSDNYMGVRGVKFASSGTNHTFSFWAKGNKVYNNFPINFGVYQVQRYINITKDWQYFTVQTGAGVTFTDHTIHFGGWGTWTDTEFDLYLWHPQLELKSHATPFTTGTRSVTQGLLDLTNNSTINLSTVSFDSSAQMTFDGTDDTVSVPSYSAIELVDNVSIEYVYMRLSTDPILDVIANKYHNTGWELFCQTGNTFALAGRNGDGTYYSTANPAYTIQNNKYYHLVAIKEALSWRLYVNGELYAYLTANSIGTWSNTGILQIGGEGAGYFPNMKLPVLKIYNRVLTASEISINFNAIKNRFNI